MAVGTTAAILIGAGLATAATVASGIMNSRATDKANKTNVDLAREQMSYQTSEREAAQEYNSPVNQAQLYEQAGFNKYLALGNMPSGETSAQTGVNVPSQVPNTALGEMLNGLGDIGSSSFNQFADLRIKDEQANMLGIDNKLKSIQLQNEAARQLLELDQRRQDLQNSKLSSSEKQKQLKYLDLQIDTLGNNLKYLDDYNRSRNQEQKNRANLVDKQVVAQQLENESKKIVNEYLPKIQESTLKQLNAAASQAWSQAALNGELKHLTSEQAITEFESRIIKKALGKREIKNYDILQSYLGEQIRAGIELQKVQIRQGKQDIENPFRYFGNAILGAGMGAFGKALTPSAVKIKGF